MRGRARHGSPRHQAYVDTLRHREDAIRWACTVTVDANEEHILTRPQCTSDRYCQAVKSASTRESITSRPRTKRKSI
eukprot:3983513-Lingulodinium_polyedra.AAC.1